ncbi:MAG: hypothetical protein BMS9Abin08_0885 [Gammaproteobacteria bacterium]|nr:MAG: hypothetical protein BMS9Abin08_0885 [Gammaproteobacteria bacterium]
MTSAAEQHVFRRIVVTLDASEADRPALETAVRLAAILGAELEGVFVEDINLIRLAGLPFLREVRPWSLAEEALSSQRMQRELRALARHAEQMLEQAVSETGVNWSFRVWRGRTEAESLTTIEADVLSLSRVSSLFTCRSRLIPKPRVQPARYTARSISVLFSDSEQAARALTAACHLANDLDARLTILLPNTGTGGTLNLQKKASAILESYALHARFVELADADAQSVAQAVSASGDTVLIAEAGHPILQLGALDQCLEELPCPLLLVR